MNFLGVEITIFKVPYRPLEQQIRALQEALTQPSVPLPPDLGAHKNHEAKRKEILQRRLDKIVNARFKCSKTKKHFLWEVHDRVDLTPREKQVVKKYLEKL